MKFDRSIWMFGALALSVSALAVDRVVQKIKVDEIRGATGSTITIPSGQSLRVDTVTNAAGTSGAPGMVPIGGMVAVMASTANAWAPPTSGQCKDGFARADGVAFSGHATCTGAVITATPPNMTAKYPRGNTTSGTTGGSNTTTLTTTQLPAHTHGGTALGVSGSPALTGAVTLTGSVGNGTLGLTNATVSGTGHTHGSGAMTAAITFSGTSVWMEEVTSSRTWPTSGYGYTFQGTGTGFSGPSGVTANARGTGASVLGSTAGPSSNVTVGLTGSVSNGTLAASNGTLATGVGTLDVSGSTDSSGTGSSYNSEPAYVEVVWVMRVK